MKKTGISVMCAVMALGGGFGLQGSAIAAPATTTTVHFTDGDPPAADTNPCTSAPGLFSDTYNGVFHETVTANGGASFTGTIVGTFTFVANSDPLSSATGRIVGWFGSNLTPGGTAVDGGTFSANGTDGYGHHISSHSLFHQTLLANGTFTAQIERNRFSCS
jgi:hypothetical protein